LGILLSTAPFATGCRRSDKLRHSREASAAGIAPSVAMSRARIMPARGRGSERGSCCRPDRGNWPRNSAGGRAAAGRVGPRQIHRSPTFAHGRDRRWRAPPPTRRPSARSGRRPIPRKMCLSISSATDIAKDAIGNILNIYSIRI
jgi:hypothetical protein